MTSDLIYLGLLVLAGIKDLRSRTIKHWQIAIFGLFILLQLLWFRHLSAWVTTQVVLVGIASLVFFLNQMLGAADVKIITLAALYNFYRFNPYWVWQVGILTGLLDLGLWLFYFRHRQKTSPLIFSWGIANLVFYVWNSL